MKLKILGTGNAFAEKNYNTCFLIEDEGKYILVDGGGGNGLFRQLKGVDCNWQDIHHVVVSHKHIDHILGLIWLVRYIADGMNKGTYEGNLTIYGNDEVIGLLKDMCAKLLKKKDAMHIDQRIKFDIIEDREERNIIGHNICFFDLHSTKAKQFGFVMDMGDGEKLTFAGDEPFTEDAYSLVRGSKWLLHEAFCLDSEAEIFKPYEKNHTTVKDSCKLAESLGIANLILYHTEETHFENHKELYTLEGSNYYSGNLFVPDDLEVIDL
ncbi:MAG: MBL fold metallo-hydrolase [Clostridia bacterium]|nr:MBL fold metallo-hydrolase [Clostridia bacterium]